MHRLQNQRETVSKVVKELPWDTVIMILKIGGGISSDGTTFVRHVFQNCT